MLTIIDRTLRLSVRSVSNRRARLALVAYWTRPDLAAQRSVICVSASGVRVRSSASEVQRLLGFERDTWLSRSDRTCPVGRQDASGIHGPSVRCCVRLSAVSPIIEPTALFRGGFYLSPMAGSSSPSWSFSLTWQPCELSQSSPTHLHH